MENLDEQFILLDQLMEPPTMEQELELEKRLRWYSEKASKEQLIRHCEAVERNHFHQTQFISNCLTEIAKCKAQIACMKKPAKPKNWLRKLLSF